MKQNYKKWQMREILRTLYYFYSENQKDGQLLFHFFQDICAYCT
jgi:hypothetical protein